MSVGEIKKSFIDAKEFNSLIVVSVLFLVNCLIRIFIWSQTVLFSFSDYKIYLTGVDKLIAGDQLYILSGNFLFGISFLGYFAVTLFGSLDFFFVLNCIVASLTGVLLYFLIVKLTGNKLAGIITFVLLTLYTEYMVFSSVFYSPEIMLFFLSLFLLLLYFYLTVDKVLFLVSSAFGILLIFLITFFFKPELQYLPWFIIVFSFFFIRKNKQFSYRLSGLAVGMLFAFLIFNKFNIVSHSKGNVISNSFVFFGHTDYGGDGGEGAFIYPENKLRYETALAEYCKTNNITDPSLEDVNAFQRREMFNFITQHPFKWVKLQFTKFFRTFGIVPEGTSFKVLYTGLLKGHLWLTSVVVVTPVALIILMFILLFNYQAIKQLFNNSSGPRAQGSGNSVSCALRTGPSTSHASRPSYEKRGFLYVYLLLFVYYVIATIFFGQYQERYRLPLMVVFIIPSVGFFIASFDKEQFFKKSTLLIKGAVIVLFLTIWTFQARKAIGNKQRFENAIESVQHKR
jgi:hypothetical protein